MSREISQVRFVGGFDNRGLRTLLEKARRLVQEGYEYGTARHPHQMVGRMINAIDVYERIIGNIDGVDAVPTAVIADAVSPKDKKQTWVFRQKGEVKD